MGSMGAKEIDGVDSSSILRPFSFNVGEDEKIVVRVVAFFSLVVIYGTRVLMASERA